MPIELSRGYITTPVSTYYHRGRQQRVDVLGTVHYADPSYYDEIQYTLDTQTMVNGAAVHYEGVQPASEQELARVPRRIRNNAVMLRTASAVVGALFDGLGMVSQVETLKHDSNWENHDVTELEIAARMNSLKVGAVTLASIMAASKGSKLDAEERRELIFSKVVRPGHREHKASWLQRVMSSDETTLDYRNGVALQAADRHFSTQPGRPLIMVWGAGHEPGLGEGLEARNFAKVHEYRLNATRV